MRVENITNSIVDAIIGCPRDEIAIEYLGISLCANALKRQD